MKKLIPKRKLKDQEENIAENSGPNSSIARAQLASEQKLAEAIKKEPAVRKIVRKSAMLAEFITEEDREANIRVIREAKEAMTRVYDKESERLIVSPDHKTRLAAATLQLAYDEGLPVQRQVVLTSNFQPADELIAKVRQSPALLGAVKALNSQGIAVEAAGEIIDVETVVQKTGSESEGDSTEKSEA